MIKHLKLDTLYVSVSEMKRAINFYNNLFQTKPSKKDDRFTEYDFGNIIFGLYCYPVDSVEVSFGTNTVPNFEAEDIESAFARVRQLTDMIDEQITSIGDYHVFQFKDPDGNLIEFFEVKAQ